MYNYHEETSSPRWKDDESYVIVDEYNLSILYRCHLFTVAPFYMYPGPVESATVDIYALSIIWKVHPIIIFAWIVLIVLLPLL